MMAKVDVKGDEQHPVYAWLTQKELNGSGDHNVRWNFHKFLVNEQGELCGRFGRMPCYNEGASRTARPL